MRAEVRTSRERERLSTVLKASPMRSRASGAIETDARPGGSVPAPAVTSTGTISMPIESLPGLSLTSLGFIDERYSVFFAATVASRSLACPGVLIGTSFMLQIGQLPGLSETTEGCIGQRYFAVFPSQATAPAESLLPQEINMTLDTSASAMAIKQRPRFISSPHTARDP